MSYSTVKVIARLVALPEKGEELQVILCGLIAPTKAEKGCLKYELLQNKADPTDFTFVEEWATETDLEVHLASEHIQKVIGEFEGLLAVAPDIRRYREIR